MRAAFVGHVTMLSKSSQLFENLNDVHILMPMFAACKVKMERIILSMRNRE